MWRTPGQNLPRRSSRLVTVAAVSLVGLTVPAAGQPRLVADLETAPNRLNWSGAAWPGEVGWFLETSHPGTPTLWHVPNDPFEPAEMVLAESWSTWDGERLLAGGWRPSEPRDPDFWALVGAEPELLVPGLRAGFPVVRRGTDTGPAEGFYYIGQASPIGDLRLGLWRYDAAPPTFTYLAPVGWSFGPGMPDPCSEIAPIGTSLVFCGSDRIWVSDGTVEGTSALTDPGEHPIGTGWPIALRGLGNGHAVFTGLNENATSFWVTDGTPSGTRPVADVTGSWLQPLTGDGTVAWAAEDYYATGPAHSGMWRIDGDLDAPEWIDSFGSVLATGSFGVIARRGSYQATGPPEIGVEPWLWQPQSGWTLLRDLTPGPERSDFWSFERDGDTLYFLADTYAAGTEVWKTDGTPAGTVPLAELEPGPSDGVSRSSTLVVLDNGDLLVARPDPATGLNRPWRVGPDGSDKGQFADFTIGTGSSDPMLFWNFGNRAWFWATVNGQRRLYSSDGTAGGTTLVPGGEALSECSPWDVAVVAPDLLVGCDLVVYQAGIVGSLVEVARFSGAGVTTVANDAPGPVPRRPLPGGEDLLHHQGIEVVRLGDKLVAYLGEHPAVIRALDLVTLEEAVLVQGDPSSSFGLLVQDDQVLFAWYNGPTMGQEIWRTDGTPAGTQPIGLELVPGSGGYIATWLSFGEHALVTSWVSPAAKLWLTDGTALGTQHLEGVAFSDQVLVGEDFLCLAGTSASDSGVLRINENGDVVAVAPLPPDRQDARYLGHSSQGGVLLVTLAGGRSVWVSDCTLEGTRKVADLPGPAYMLQTVLVHGDALWLSREEVTGRSLERLLLTTGEFETVTTWPPLLDGGSPAVSAIATESLLYLRAADETSGQELWAVDHNFIFGDGFESGDLARWGPGV